MSTDETMTLELALEIVEDNNLVSELHELMSETYPSDDYADQMVLVLNKLIEAAEVVQRMQTL